MDESLPEGPADPLGRPAMLLVGDERGVQGPPDILDHMVGQHGDLAGLAIDPDPGDVSRDRWRETHLLRVRVAFDRRSPGSGIGPDDLRDRDRPLRRAPRPDRAVDELEVGRIDLELT